MVVLVMLRRRRALLLQLHLDLQLLQLRLRLVVLVHVQQLRAIFRQVLVAQLVRVRQNWQFAVCKMWRCHVVSRNNSFYH